MNINIAQAEFFHIGRGESLANTFRSSVPFKTSVRFFDRTGILTGLGDLDARLRKEEKDLMDGLSGASMLRKWLLSIRGKFLSAKQLRLTQQIPAVASHLLAEELRAGNEVAIENPDRSFRPVRPSETDDILDIAHRSGRAMLFVFAPNDLCSDTNTPIARAM